MHGVYPVHGAFVARVVLVPLAALAAVGLTWLTASGTWAYLGRLRLRSRRRVPLVASARTDLNTSGPN
jgi:hypothetical protein